MDKMIVILVEVVVDVFDNVVLMIGGFGGLGVLIEFIYVLIDWYKVIGSLLNLMVVNNNVGNGKIGIVVMIDVGMVVKMVCLFLWLFDLCVFIDKYLVGEIEFELVLQGILVECICVGGVGIFVFFILISYGIELVEGKQIQEFDGKVFVMECWLKVDFVIVKGYMGDFYGNLIYCLVGCNFNLLMCMVVVKIIVQVSMIVELGGIDFEQVIILGLFVDGVVEVSDL